MSHIKALPEATSEQITLNIARWRAEQSRKAEKRAMLAAAKKHLEKKGHATIGDLLVSRVLQSARKEKGK